MLFIPVTGIVNLFGNLEKTYDLLNEFWGELVDDAKNIMTFDSIVLDAGVQVLTDESALIAAKQVASDLSQGAKAYLKMLHDQRVVIPDQVAMANGLPATPPITVSARALKVQKHTTHFASIITSAKMSLKSGDMAQYFAKLGEASVLQTANHLDDLRAETATGLWLDVSKLQQAGSVFGKLPSTPKVRPGDPTPQPVDPPPPAQEILLPDANAPLPQQSQQLQSALIQLGPRLADMLRHTVDLADAAQVWKDQFPQIPPASKQPEAAKLQQKAVDQCHLAFEWARSTNNSFVKFSISARDFSESAVKAVNVTKANRDADLARFDEDIRGYPHTPPWYVYAIAGIGAAGWFAQQAAEKDDVQRHRNDAGDSWTNQISQAQALADSGPNMNGPAGDWLTATANVSDNLGRIAEILSAEHLQLSEDPAMYAKFMQTEWTQVKSHAQAALDVLEKQPPAPLLSTAKSMCSRRRNMSQGQQVAHALQAPSDLSVAIKSQSTDAIDCFRAIDTLLQLPNTNDIIGYWKDDGSDRKTLATVIDDMRTQYVNLLSAEYSTILSIQEAAQLQAIRADLAATGRMQLVNFVKQSFRTITTTTILAGLTKAKFDKMQDHVTAILAEVDKNISVALANIDNLSTEIDKDDKQLQDKIAWVVADSIALVFASAVLLAAFGVGGAVLAFVTLAAQIGAVASVTASGIKLALDSKGLSELTQTIAALKATRETLKTSVHNMQAVQPAMKNVVASAAGIGPRLETMASDLQAQLLIVNQWQDEGITPEDARSVKQTWEDVSNACQGWLDAYNREGFIIPDF